MLTVAELRARLSADTGGFNRDLGGAERKLSDFGSHGEKSVVQVANGFAGVERASARMAATVQNHARMIGTAFTSMATTVGIAAGGLLSASLFKGFDRMTTIENSTKAMTVVLGDAAKAASLLDGILQVVRGTPFNLDQFAEAGKNLVAFGTSAQKVPGILRAVGEAAAASGGSAQSVQTIVDALGDATSIGRITGDTLQRLAQQGIPALKILANSFGMSAEEMQKAVSDGMVPAEKGIDALTQGIMKGTTGAAGATTAFAGTMAGLRTTLTGALGGLSAAGARFGASMLKPFSPSMVKMIGAVSDAVDNLAKVIGPMLDRIVATSAWSTIVGVFEKLPSSIGSTLDKVREFAPALAPLAGIIASIATTQLKGLLGPIGALVPGFGLLTGAIAGLAASSPKLREAFADVGKTFMTSLAPAIPAITRSMGLLSKAVAATITALIPLVAWGVKLASTFATKLAAPIIEKVAQALYDLTNMAGGFFRAFKSGDVETSWNPLMQKASEFGVRMRELADKVRNVFDNIMDKVGGVGNLFKMLTPIVAGFALFFVDTKISRGITAIISVTKGLFATWTANPMLAAIELIIVGFLLAYKSIKPFRDAVDNLIKYIQTNATPAIQFLKEKFGQLGVELQKLWGKIKDTARSVEEWAKTNPIIQNVIGKIEEMNISLTDVATGAAGFALAMQAWDILAPIVGAVIGYFQNLRLVIAEAGGAQAAFWAVVAWGQGVMATVTGAATGMWAAITGPVGLVIAAVVAVGVAIYAAYKNIKPFREAIDSLWQNVQKAWDAILNGARAAGAAIVELWRSATEKVSEWWDKNGKAITEAAGHIWNVLKVIFIAIGAVIIAPFYAAWKVISWVWDKIGSHVIDIAQRIWKVVGGVFKNIGQVIAGVFMFIVNLINGDWGNAWDSCISVIKGLAGIFWSVFRELPGIIWSAIKGIASLLGGLAELIIKGVAGAGKWLWNTGKDMLSGMWNGAVEGAKALINFIFDLPTMLINAATDARKWLWQTGKDIFNGIVDGIQLAAPILWDWLKSLPARIWEFLKAAPGWLVGTGKSIINGLWTGIQNGAQAVWNWLKALPSKILEGAKDASKWLFDTGKNLVSGLINGIRDAWGKVWEFIKGKLTNLWDAVKGFFGISSPSKKFAWAGDMLMEGLAKGIRDNKSAEEAMDKKAQIIASKAAVIARTAEGSGGGGGGGISNPFAAWGQAAKGTESSRTAAARAKAGADKMERLDKQGPKGKSKTAQQVREEAALMDARRNMSAAQKAIEEENDRIVEFMSTYMSDEQKRAENSTIDDIVQQWKNDHPYATKAEMEDGTSRVKIRRWLRLVANAKKNGATDGSSSSSSSDSSYSSAPDTSFSASDLGGGGEPGTGSDGGLKKGMTSGYNFSTGAFMAWLKGDLGGKIDELIAAQAKSAQMIVDAWNKTYMTAIPADGKFKVDIPALPAAVYTPNRAATGASGALAAQGMTSPASTSASSAQRAATLLVQGDLVIGSGADATTADKAAQKLVDRLQDYSHLSGAGIGTGSVVVEGNW